MQKSPHDTTNLRTRAQVSKLEPSPLTYTEIFCVNENLSIICFIFIAMIAPLLSWASNNPNNDVFRLLVGREEIHNHGKNVMALFDIQRLKVCVVIKHFTKVGWTYFVNVDCSPM